MPAKGKSSWIKSNYEMAILLVVLVALLASASVLVIRVGVEKGKFTETKAYIGQSGKRVAPLEIVAYREVIKDLKRPLPKVDVENRMFVSEKRVWCVECGKPIPYYAKACPFCDADQPVGDENTGEQDSDADGMLDKYEQEHGFDENDPDDAEMDADGDGFTNLEEYKAGTDPRDENDTPPLTEKLRLIRVKRNPFKLRFNSVQELPNDVFKFQLNLRTLRRTYFPEVGDEINDRKNRVTGVKIIEYLPDAKKGPTLIVEKDNETIRLVKDRPVTEYDLTAAIVFLLDKKIFHRQIDETIDLRGKEFKVIDIGRDYVLLKDVASGKEYRVPKISEQEKMEFRQKSSDSQSRVPFGAEGGFETGGRLPGRDMRRR